MFRREKDNAISHFAIDLGGFRTRFFSETGGLLLDQPSIAALDMDHPIGGSRSIVAFGDQAEKILANQPDGLRSIRPVQLDHHNESGLSSTMLAHFLKHARRAGLIARSTEISLMLPHDCSEKISQQLQQTCKAAGARQVELQDTALAAFQATEFEQSEPCIMIDFGATGSRLFAIANGQVVDYYQLSCGGDELDRALSDGLLQRFNLYVSDESAREIKHSVAAATPLSLIQCTRNSCETNCLSVETNKTAPFTISSETINQILQPELAALRDSLQRALTTIDASIKDAAYENGIKICGGGALLSRMDQLVMSATDLPVEVVPQPLTSNIRGAAATAVATSKAYSGTRQTELTA